MFNNKYIFLTKNKQAAMTILDYSSTYSLLKYA